MRSHLISCLIAIGLLCSSTPAFAQGKIVSLREAMSTPPPPKSSSSSSSSSHHDDDYCYHDDCCDNDDHPFAEFFGKVFLVGVSSPFWLPASVLEQDGRTDTNFASFPYNHNHDGYLMFDTLEQDANRDDPWAIRVLSEYGTDFDGLDRYGGRLMLDTSSRLGIDTEWNHWWEDLGPASDELWTGDINLIFRFAQSEHAQFRAGLGWNWLQDDVLGHQNGFNFTYGFDLFPAEPFVIDTTIDWGRIDSSTLIHVRSTAGVVWEHVELFAGYDFRNLDSVNLSGFVGGVTLWW